MIFTSTLFICKLVTLPTNRLEDTLIDLYLSGYKNIAVSEADGVTVPLETDDRYNSLAADGLYITSIFFFCYVQFVNEFVS